MMCSGGNNNVVIASEAKQSKGNIGDARNFWIATGGEAALAMTVKAIAVSV